MVGSPPKDERREPGSLLSSPPQEEPEPARALRARLFTDLDRLAFALEMEAAELLETGDEPGAARRQELRLGVRLAQRLVADVWADETHQRIRRWAEAYDARLGQAIPADLGPKSNGRTDGPPFRSRPTAAEPRRVARGSAP